MKLAKRVATKNPTRDDDTEPPTQRGLRDSAQATDRAGRVRRGPRRARRRDHLEDRRRQARSPRPEPEPGRRWSKPSASTARRRFVRGSALSHRAQTRPTRLRPVLEPQRRIPRGGPRAARSPRRRPPPARARRCRPRPRPRRRPRRPAARRRSISMPHAARRGARGRRRPRARRETSIIALRSGPPQRHPRPPAAARARAGAATQRVRHLGRDAPRRSSGRSSSSRPAAAPPSSPVTQTTSPVAGAVAQHERRSAPAAGRPP